MHRDLTDAQWWRLDPLIPEPQRRKDGRGRPWRGRREVLNGILFILRSGPRGPIFQIVIPPYQTCHRRFQQWVRSGIMRGILEALAEELRVSSGFHLEEAFIDGSFATAKKGLLKPVKTATYVPYTMEVSVFTQIVVRTRSAPLTVLNRMR